MLDQNDRDADGGKLAEHLVDQRGVRGVEPGGRFVERQYGGTYGKRARDLDQPLVDVRERPGGHVDRTAIADEGEQAFGGGGARLIVLRGKERGGAELSPAQRDQHVVDDRQALEQPAGLIGARDPRPRDLMSTQLRDGLLAELHRARVGAIEAADGVERGSLAGAIGADDAGDRSGARVEAQIPDRMHAAEAHSEIAH